MTKPNVTSDSPVDWCRRVNMENWKMTKEKNDAQIALVDDDWEQDESTGIYEGIPAEPTRKQSLAEIQGQLDKAFGTNESRTLEIDPSLWSEVDLSDLEEPTLVVKAPDAQ